ncbi:hemolysin family protein [Arundinibacter roseus]|uniref:HlyC/CorC family transporter n=1 Tax=Arundinibacter roseus TaxID=2070510 RepID=A0A4R4KNM5_9BACT|nr:hemolysin family protein [Arundinibacter roseus]TDB68171.1 HlyC/CorC family transporter [Arundinibacter roseus]
MNVLYPTLAVVFFFFAGYFGAVRAILLDLPAMIFSSGDDSVRLPEQVAYWRRILRMARLLIVAFGSFYLVMTWFTYLPNLSEPWHLALLFLVAILLWISSYMSWLQIGRLFPAVVSLKAFPVRLAEWGMTPVYWVLEPFMNHASAESRAHGFGREESASADDTENEDHRMEERMFINALDFKDVRIRDCMIPRTEITAVALEDTIEDLRQAFISSGHSKIVVYRDSIDEVVGYCHSLALFRKPKEIANIITPILIVPEAMPASDLMLRFLEERKSLALVVDEFGGTSGLVSVEDVVEQIFGEIQDEYDTTEDWTERSVDEHTYIFSARHEVDYLNEKYDWKFPEGDYDTLAGMLIHVHGDLPKVNDDIRVAPYTFTIISMQDTRIELVRMTMDH